METQKMVKYLIIAAFHSIDGGSIVAIAPAPVFKIPAVYHGIDRKKQDQQGNQPEISPHRNAMPDLQRNIQTISAQQASGGIDDQSIIARLNCREITLPECAAFA